MRRLIREGDTTTHKGKVLRCSPLHLLGARAIARFGDMVYCPQCSGVFPITEIGDPTINVGGKPAALEGDKTACGAALLRALAAKETTPAPAEPPGCVALDVAHELGENSKGRYLGRFHILDATNGSPLAALPYAYVTHLGARIEGVTDIEGRTAWQADTAPPILLFARRAKSALIEH
ncbi:PAAR domain-containing protein [Paraburkholderia sp. Ac-20347]|uniref:PAAR domain-containing protein n=1 Tax=Paraburkholderia sp. Ac-20347 TaxID=2703892 RepID=UPI00197FC975|nr:PAAR domain-containing protein [Paraburkholderia sp. Ac-20347]MBN3808772.1 PAAR domain-containing protein [Paraburkholderia sp. Ac-20347]